MLYGGDVKLDGGATGVGAERTLDERICPVWNAGVVAPHCVSSRGVCSSRRCFKHRVEAFVH